MNALYPILMVLTVLGTWKLVNMGFAAMIRHWPSLIVDPDANVENTQDNGQDADK